MLILLLARMPLTFPFSFTIEWVKNVFNILSTYYLFSFMSILKWQRNRKPKKKKMEIQSMFNVLVK